jgi:hypothetical protein
MTASRSLTWALAAAVSLLLVNYSSISRAASGVLPVTLHSRGGAQGTKWPLTFGVPFPDETLSDDAKVRLVGPGGAGIPIQVRTTGRWLNGATRWVLIDTQLRLPSDKATYQIQWGDGVVRSGTNSDRVTVSDSDRSVTVNTGPLQFTITKDNLSLFSAILVRDIDGQMKPVLPEGKHPDLVQEDGNGTVYRGSLASNPEVKIEESGPLRVSIKLEGWMQSEDGRQLGRRIVRVQALAGKRWLRIYDTWVNTGDSNEVAYRNIAFHLPFEGDQYSLPGTPASASRQVQASDYLLQYDHDKYEIVSAGRVFAEGHRSKGKVTVGQGDTKLSVAVRHFWQMCPGEIQINPGLLKLNFWPRHGHSATHSGDNVSLQNLGHLWWVHEGEVLDFKMPPEVYEKIWPGPAGFDVGSRANAFGISRTFEYTLDFHGATAPDPSAASPDSSPVMVVDPRWLADSQAFWNIAPWREPYLEVEHAAAAPLDFFVTMFDRLNDYGLWNFGSYHKSYLPTLDGSARHNRHWVDFHHGGPRWPWLVFVRSGEPRYFDFAEINTRHGLDVATCHWEDVEYNRKYIDKAPRSWLTLKYLGGMCKYNQLVHWGAGSRMGYNSMVDYALWYYYMTGYQRAWDVAMMNGEFLLRWNDPMPLDPGNGSNPILASDRNGMGRGAMAVTLYRATHDKRYLSLANKQMKYFRDRTDEETSLEPGFRHIIYAPFVERYWELTHDPTLQPYILKWTRDWMQSFSRRPSSDHPDHAAWCEHWGVRDTWYNLMALAYQLTGEEEFLQYGLQQARLFLETRGTNADPILEGVALFSDYPGVAGYTAQQFGHFVKALEQHEQKAGNLLALPTSPETPMIDMPYRGNHFVFYVRKAAGEEVTIPFVFKSSGKTIVTIENPAGIETKQEITPDEAVATYDLALTGEVVEGEYRIEFQSEDLLTTFGPPRGGQYTQLVLERPYQLMSGVRICFAPRVSPDGNPATVRLMTSLRPHELQTHRLYRPDGSVALARTLQLGPPHRKGDIYTVGELLAEPPDQGQPWVYTRMAYGTGWVEGDVYPVVAFRPAEFFVPERFCEE